MESGMRSRLAWLLLAAGVVGLVVAPAMLPYVGLVFGTRQLFRVIDGYWALYGLTLAPIAMVMQATLLVIRGRRRDVVAAVLGALAVVIWYAALPTVRGWVGRTGNPQSLSVLVSMLCIATALLSVFSIVQAASLRREVRSLRTGTGSLDAGEQAHQPDAMSAS